ncbi:MAG: SUF system Fe-S cluster assembly protein, partial [Candidatus Puniceispirillaceae bacterium]
MTGAPSPPGKTFSEDGPSLADFLPDTSSGYTAYAGTAPDEGTGSPLTEEAVITALKTVKDPEIPVNIYDL